MSEKEDGINEEVVNGKRIKGSKEKIEELKDLLNSDTQAQETSKKRLDNGGSEENKDDKESVPYEDYFAFPEDLEKYKDKTFEPELEEKKDYSEYDDVKIPSVFRTSKKGRQLANKAAEGIQKDIKDQGMGEKEEESKKSPHVLDLNKVQRDWKDLVQAGGEESEQKAGEAETAEQKDQKIGKGEKEGKQAQNKEKTVGLKEAREVLREKGEITEVDLSEEWVQKEMKDTIEKLRKDGKLSIAGFNKGTNKELLDNYLLENLKRYKVNILSDDPKDVFKQFPLEAVLVDLTKVAEERAYQMATQQLNDQMHHLSSREKKGFLERIKGLSKIGVLHSGEDYYKESYKLKALNGILSNKDLFVDVDLTKKGAKTESANKSKDYHQAEVSAIISKYLFTKEMGQEEPQIVDKRLNVLATALINGHISREDFEKKRDILVNSNDFKARWKEVLKFSEIAEDNIDEAVRHLGIMQEMALNDIVDLTQDKTRFNSKITVSKVDKIIATIQGNKYLGKWVNPAIIGLGFSLLGLGARKVFGSKLAQISTIGGGAIVAGSFAAARRSKEVKVDRYLHEYQRTAGREFNSELTQRAKMEKFLFEKISFSEAIDQLDEFSKGKLTKERYEELVDNIAEIKARIEAGRHRGIDFISYSSEYSIAQEKLLLQEKLHQATGRALDYLEKELDIKQDPNGYWESLMASKVAIHSMELRTHAREQDEAFVNFRYKESAKAALVGVAIGAGIAGAIGLVQNYAYGYFAGGGVKTVTETSGTRRGKSVTEFMRPRGVHEHLPKGYHETVVPTKGPDFSSNLRLPQGNELVPSGKGGFNIIDAKGKTIVSEIKFGDKGEILNPSKLKEAGFFVNTKSTPRERLVDFYEATKENKLVEGIKRLWHENSTPKPRHEGKELLLHIKAEGNRNIIDASRMDSNLVNWDGSHDILSSRLKEAIVDLGGGRKEFRGMYALLSPTGADSKNPIMIPLNANGQLEVGPNSDYAQFFQGGKFLGRFLEIGYKHPDGKWDILATEVGAGKAPETVTKTATDTIIELTKERVKEETKEAVRRTIERRTAPFIFDFIPYIPITPRKPLEPGEKSTPKELEKPIEAERKQILKYWDKHKREKLITKDGFNKINSIWKELKDGKIDLEESKKQLKDLSKGKDMGFLDFILSGGMGKYKESEMDLDFEFDRRGDEPALIVRRPLFGVPKGAASLKEGVEQVGDKMGKIVYKFRKRDLKEVKEEQEEAKKAEEEEEKPEEVKGTETEEPKGEGTEETKETTKEIKLTGVSDQTPIIFAPVINIGNTKVGTVEVSLEQGVKISDIETGTQEQTPISTFTSEKKREGKKDFGKILARIKERYGNSKDRPSSQRQAIGAGLDARILRKNEEGIIEPVNEEGKELLEFFNFTESVQRDSKEEEKNKQDLKRKKTAKKTREKKEKKQASSKTALDGQAKPIQNQNK